MKIVRLIPAIFLAGAVFADTAVRLAWDPNPESEGQLNYLVEWWPTNSAARLSTNVGLSTSVVVTITDAVPWTFRVRAATAFATSAPSTEVKLQVKPSAPKNLSVTVPGTTEVKAFAR